MFIPLGVGSRLKRFPYSIVAIVTICIAWSTSFFPVLKSSGERLKSELETKTNDGEKAAYGDLLKAACKVRGIEDCNDLKESQKSNQVAFERPSDSLDDPNQSVETKRKPATELLSQAGALLSLISELQGDHQRWPADIRKLSEYGAYVRHVQSQRDIIKRVHIEEGFLIKGAVTISRVLKASFTHGDWMHLFSNLLMLVIIGIWIEQLAGSFGTALLFLSGSFVGLLLQVYLEPNKAVLGASAGVFCLMGVFFAFFYQKRIHFLFTIFPVYFKRLYLPALWTFPFFYFIGEVANAHGGDSGVAHYAHLGGLAFGLSAGVLLKKSYELGTDEVCLEERPLVEKINRARSANEAWTAFTSLMEWNRQNWHALEKILSLVRQEPISLSEKQIEFLADQLQYAAGYYLKKNEVFEHIKFIKSIPAFIDLTECIQNAPTSQLLFIADTLANQNQLPEARRVYLAVASGKRHRKSSHLAAKAINRIDELIQDQIGRS